MTMKHNLDQGQINALIAIGVIPEGMDKEAMEKKAIWGMLAKAGKGLAGAGSWLGRTKGIARVGRGLAPKLVGAGKSMQSYAKPGIMRGLGKQVGKKNALSIAEGGKGINSRKAVNRLYNKKYGTPAPKPQVKVDGQAAAARLRERKLAEGANRQGVRERYNTTPGRKTGQTQSQLNQAKAGQTASQAGNPYATGSYTPYKPPTTPQLSGAQTPVGQVPTMPTDQSRLMGWAKENPLLAGGGGILGYKALNSNNNDNIVVGR